LVGPAADFSFEILSFNNDTLLQNEKTGERFLVYNGTLQITFTLRHWKFCNQDISCSRDNVRERGNYLDFDLKIKGKITIKYVLQL